MKGLNLSSFRKIKEDKHSATMKHEDGHTLTIAKSALPAIQRKQLEKLPMYAEGGQVQQQQQQSTPPEKKTLGQTIGYPGYADGGRVQHYANGTPDAENATVATSLQDPRALNLDQAQSQESQDAAPYGISPAPAPTSSDSMSTSQASATPAELPSSASPQSAPPLAQTPIQAQAGAFKEEQAANLAGAQALQAQGKAESKAIQDTQSQIGALPTQAQLVAANKDASDKLYKAYADKTLDPDHYWHQLGTAGQISSGIGMILSGIGSGITGQPNMALQLLQKGIDRDIEAQKNSQDQKMNLWKMNREALGNDLAANLATQNQYYTALKYKLDQAAANAKGPIALANAQAANAHIQQALDMNNFKLGLMNPSSDNPDPAARVQFLVPAERQQKVFDEIDAAKNTVANAPGILEAFDQAAKEVRPLTGGSETSLTAFVPGMKSPGQKALVARMGPTFNDIEHTVRQAAMDNMEHNVSPNAFDNDSTIASKRATLVKYLRSKEAASTAKGFGIDLSRYPSTASHAIGSMAEQPSQQPQASKSGRPIVYVNGKAFYK